ncbi:unnamed protein product, partial [marine sediment metagenome]
GYTKSVKKLYNKGFHEFEDERIPNANVRFSEKFTVTEDGTLTTITIPAGQQLRLIYLNWWCLEGTAILVITQAGGTAHGLPDGQVDAIPSDAQKHGTYKNPIHILEGTVTFEIQGVGYEGAEVGLSVWGDANSPQIDP